MRCQVMRRLFEIITCVFVLFTQYSKADDELTASSSNTDAARAQSDLGTTPPADTSDIKYPPGSTVRAIANDEFIEDTIAEFLEDYDAGGDLRGRNFSYYVHNVETDSPVFLQFSPKISRRRMEYKLWVDFILAPFNMSDTFEIFDMYTSHSTLGTLDLSLYTDPVLEYVGSPMDGKSIFKGTRQLYIDRTISLFHRRTHRSGTFPHTSFVIFDDNAQIVRWEVYIQSSNPFELRNLEQPI